MKQKGNSQSGTALLTTVVLVLIVTLVIGTVLLLSDMRFNLALLKRYTNNTYALAIAAVEKQVDTMNKAIEMEINQIISGLNNNYIRHLMDETDLILYENKEGKLQVDNNTLVTCLENEIFSYLKRNLIEQEEITYRVQGDREKESDVTYIRIKTTAVGENKLLVTAVATTQTVTQAICDEQKVEAVIEIQMPSFIEHQIHERYALASGEKPEILNNALLSFSDVIVSSGGRLKVTSGDVRVSGAQRIENFGTNSEPKFAEVSQQGGIIAMNGGKIKIADNLYCTNNVLATNGWGASVYNASTSIAVDKNIVAHTLGIIDDYYEASKNQMPFDIKNQVANAVINVGKNVMVDNDVMISRWVNGGMIQVGQTIFGVNGGTDTTQESISGVAINPNQSSGVFAQGSGSQIIADRMLVAGQPYITLQEGTKPLKVWESIGKPFDGLASYEGYVPSINEERETNKHYLTDLGDLLNLQDGDKKIQTDFSQSYAVAGISGYDTSTSTYQIGALCKDIFGGREDEAARFFYLGGGADFSTFVSGEKTKEIQEIDEIISHLSEYTQGNKLGYRRNIGLPGSEYHGLRGYMMLMRSIFYQDISGSIPVKANFSQVIKVDNLPDSERSGHQESWSYASPICVTNGGEIDVSKFYVSEDGGETYEAQPSIIISKGINHTEPLILKSSDNLNNTFKGIIVSEGPVEIASDLKIEGSLIIGGPQSMPDLTEDRKGIFTAEHAGLVIEGHTLEIKHDIEGLTNIRSRNQTLYRQILDALCLTAYMDHSMISEIMGSQGLSTTKLLRYTNQSMLEVDGQNIRLKIKSLKRKAD